MYFVSRIMESSSDWFVVIEVCCSLVVKEPGQVRRSVVIIRMSCQSALIRFAGPREAELDLAQKAQPNEDEPIASAAYSDYIAKHAWSDCA